MPGIRSRTEQQGPIRATAGAAGILLFAWGLIPVFSSRLHVGCIVLMLAGSAGPLPLL